MRSKLLPIFLLLLIQFLFLLPLFTHPFYQSHDGELHLARFAAYIIAFHDGNIPPRWAGNLSYGYGAPVLNFFAPLAGYLATALYLAELDLATAFKIVLGATFALAPITFYIWLSQTALKKAAFIGALLFGLAPYQLLNLYVRGDIGELLGILFVPLILASINTNFTAAAVGFALLILSHNAISLIFAPIILLYILITTDKKTIWKPLVILVLGLGLSAYFWIPSLWDQQFLNNLLFPSMFQGHFATLPNLIYKSWGFGTEIAKPGGLSPQIGPLLSILAFASIFLVKHAAVQRKRLFFWIAVLLTGIFLSTPASLFLWKKFTLLSKLQFPWRFVSLITFSSVMLATYTIKSLNKTWFTFVIAAFAIAISIPYAKISKPIVATDEAAFSHNGTTALHGEATTRWTAGDASAIFKAPLQIIAGSGAIENVVRKTARHTFTATSNTDITVLDNTTYFPGWKAYVDGNEAPIEFQNPNHRGLITFIVPQGQHSVTVAFRETKVRMLANAISLVSLGFVIVLLLLSAVIPGLTRNPVFTKDGSRLRGRDDK